jgi:hypothetical protein
MKNAWSIVLTTLALSGLGLQAGCGSQRRAREVPEPAAFEGAAPAVSCDVLCAVQGGPEECPVGTPCPRSALDEASAKIEAFNANVYSGSGPDEMCTTEP